MEWEPSRGSPGSWDWRARSQPLALEREKPLPPGQTTFETYRIATVRMLKVFRDRRDPAAVPRSPLLGLVMAGARADRARAGLFLAIVLAASAVALVRLHATGGYCTVRHGLVPGLILTLAAAYGLTWLIGKLSIPGRWLGLACVRDHDLAPLSGLWRSRLSIVTVNISLAGTAECRSVLRLPRDRPLARPEHRGRRAGARPDRLVALLQPAARATSSPTSTRHPPTPTRAGSWSASRTSTATGTYSEVIRELIGGRAGRSRPAPGPSNQVQIRIYDRLAPVIKTATTVHMSPARSFGLR